MTLTIAIGTPRESHAPVLIARARSRCIRAAYDRSYWEIPNNWNMMRRRIAFMLGMRMQMGTSCLWYTFPGGGPWPNHPYALIPSAPGTLRASTASKDTTTAPPFAPTAHPAPRGSRMSWKAMQVAGIGGKISVKVWWSIWSPAPSHGGNRGWPRNRRWWRAGGGGRCVATYPSGRWPFGHGAPRLAERVATDAARGAATCQEVTMVSAASFVVGFAVALGLVGAVAVGDGASFAWRLRR